MASGTAERSIGTTLTIVDTPEVEIAYLTTIGEIGIESEEIDTTTLDSTGGYREYIASLKDAGEMNLEGMIKTEDDHEDMLDIADDQEVLSWRIDTVSGSKWEFDGFLKTYKEGESTVDGVRTFSGSIRISGKPVYTPAETPSV